MNLISAINFLLIAGAIQGFLFNLFTIFYEKRFGKVMLYLNLTVLFISLNNLQAWLTDNGYSSGIFFIKHLQIPWYVMVIPTFYIFLVHFLKVEEKVRSVVKLSWIVFGSEIILRTLLILYLILTDLKEDTSMIRQYSALEELVNILFCLYLFRKAWILVFRQGEIYSYILGYDDIKWIKAFLKFGSLIMALWCYALLNYHISGNMFAYYPLRLGTSVLLYWIGYQGLFRYRVVQERILLRNTLASQPQPLSIATTASSVKNSFLNEKHHEEFERVKFHIIENQRYLDPNFQLDLLATELGISTSHLSKLINAYSDSNFSDFINSFRVSRSKILLKDHTFSNYTIVAIGLECGFNSRSTFYSAFKKFTTQTPSEFKSSS